FVSLTPGKDGLLHVTQLRKLNDGKRVDDVGDVVTVGQKIEVEIREIDARGKISLAVIDEDEAPQAAESAASEEKTAERPREAEHRDSSCPVASAASPPRVPPASWPRSACAAGASPRPRARVG